MARTVALLFALGGALLWALLAIAPPPPLGTDASSTTFSATRAFVHIEAIARRPRPVGSDENARVRLYLAEQLRGLGAEVTQQVFPLPSESLERLGRWSGHTERAVFGHNLIGLIPGVDRTRPALVLMGHHDSVWGSPGAGDDAMALASALEVTRALTARGKPGRDLILLFTDSEEVGLDGATAYFTHHPLAARTGVIINMEARGSGGRANMFETGPGNGEQMKLYASVVKQTASRTLAVLVYDLMPNATDYTIAREHGYAGYNIAVLDRAWSYHSPLATPASVDRASLQDMGDQALALASALAFSRELPARTPNATFADLMGRVTVVYPANMGWLILLISATLIGVSLRRTQPPVRVVAQGMVLVTASLLYGALLLTAFNAVSGSGVANYYDRLAAIPRLEIMAALLIAALMMLIEHLRRSERLQIMTAATAIMWASVLTGGPLALTVAIALPAIAIGWILPPPVEDDSAGAILLLLVVATFVQGVLPTAGPSLQWPLLLASLAMTARSFLRARVGLAITALAAAIGLGHLLTQAHFIFLSIGPETPAALMVLLFAAWPLLKPLWPDRWPRWIPAVILGVALFIALWVRLDPMAQSVPRYSLKDPIKTRD